MSQSGVLSVNTSGGAVTETLTGNSGGPVSPDGSFNINVVGNNTSGINIVGNPGTHTLTVTAFQATTTQEGTVTLATNAQAIAGTDTANALTSSNLAAKLGTQTAHSLAVFEGSSSALTALGAATNGQLPIGSTGADPVLASITSAGGTISITNGAGSISLDVNGSKVGETITGNSGGALSPTAGNWNILGASTAAGTSPVTSSGAGSTLTMNVQKAQAIAATDATKVGLANFNSTQFTVDANGFVSAIAGGSGISTINGDTGSITGATVTIFANNATLNCGSSVSFVNSGTISTLNVTDALDNTIIGAASGNATLSGADNTGVGYNCLSALTSGHENSAFGHGALVFLTTGGANLALGETALRNLVSGSTNIAVGLSAGLNYTGAESSNLIIGNTGVLGESNVIRIGTQGSGNGQQNQCFVAGIAGVTSVSSAVVAGLATGTGQLVQTTITAGTGISVTPAAGTITIAATGTTTLNYTSVNHAASPYTVLSTDDYIGVNSTAGVVSILLPNAPATGRVLIIKDSNAQAATNNITVTTVGGVVTIDGSTSYVMKTNYQSIQVIFNGTSYEVF